MPIEDFIILVFCRIEEIVQKIATKQPWRTRGFPQKLSDSEVITMEVVGEILSIDTAKLFAYAMCNSNGMAPLSSRGMALLSSRDTRLLTTHLSACGTALRCFVFHHHRRQQQAEHWQGHHRGHERHQHHHGGQRRLNDP